METEAYWHSRRHLWSLRRGGRVVDQVPFVTLARCAFIVREGERRRALERRQRSVHAWVRGEYLAETEDNALGMVQVGYNFRLAGTFTARPTFTPIYAARRVVLRPDGTAWALL